MAKFPTKEADISALADQMVAGYKAHMADFPSVSWPFLRAMRIIYKNSRNVNARARSKAILATESKQVRLGELKGIMKSCLKISEVDVAGNPEKLALIGWGPKAAAQTIEPPLSPRNLTAKLQGKGTILLLWESPSSGGAVRNYIIQRRQQLAAGDDLNVWSIAGSALKTEINLTDQPRGVQLEYRIKAANTGGESVPSNTVAVVL